MVVVDTKKGDSDVFRRLWVGSTHDAFLGKKLRETQEQ